MADVSRSVYLSKKLSSVNDETSRHIYDGIFSPPPPTKLNVSPFSSRIDDYREMFPPSNASLGSSIPILDLPAADRSAGPARPPSGVDYAGVFGGFGDSDGIGPPPEQLLRDAKKMAKRDAQLPRSPAQKRRLPSKSQEFSCNYGNDQASPPSQTMRMPSKSQEFSRNYGNDQTSSPVQTRRMPSKSQEFSDNYGNDQTSTPAQTMKMPSKSQEFSCESGNDQRSSPVQTRRMPPKSQEFSCEYGNDQRSSSEQTRRMPSKSQEFSVNYGKDQRPTPAPTMRMPSESQEFSVNYGNDQTPTPAQTMRMPTKSQEFSFNNGNDQTSTPQQIRRRPSKSQEFSRNQGNDQTSSLAQTRMQHSKSQEFSLHFSNNQISTSPLQTRSPSIGDDVSGNSPNDQTSAGALPHQSVESVEHVSVSYNETKQLSKDGTNGTMHIAHLHAVPGYTLLCDEAGPVRKTGFVKAKRLSMNDADFSGEVGKVSRQGKHTRAVSDLGTNKQACDHSPGFQENFGGGGSHFVASHSKLEFSCKPQTRSMSVSNSPQSFGGSDYFKRSANRRSNGSTNNQAKNADDDSFPLLDEEFDVNSDAAVSAAAMERAIEEAEERIRWAKEFLMGLEGIGFIKPTLKDSFKVKATADTCHSYETYGSNQNGGLKAARKKKCINEDKVRRRNSHLKVKASAENSHADEAGETQLKDDLDTNESQLEKLKKELHEVAGNRLSMDTTMRRPSAPETLEETPESFSQSDSVNDGGLADNTTAHEELKLAKESCKHDGGGEWEAAKHLSQLLTGVKNRLVSFISKQADVEKMVVQKQAPGKCESLEQSEERAFKVQNVDTNQERDADLEYSEKKLGMNHSTCSEAGESGHDSIRNSVDMEICGGENEVNKSEATSSLDVEMLTSKQRRQSESEEESECIEAQETTNSTNELNEDVCTEVKGEVLQEVQEQNPEILDATMKTGDESQVGAIELEECDEIPEKACESKTYDGKGTDWEDEEGENKVQGLVPLKKSINEFLDSDDVNSRQIEDCSLKEIEMPKDAQAQQGHVGMIEEACMLEGRCERVVEGKVINAERVTGKDITAEATGGLTEVFGDISEHDEHLAAAADFTKQDESFLSKNEEASMPDETIQYTSGVGFPPEDKGSMTDSATVPFEPEEDIKQCNSVQRANELFREGICEETLCSSEVVDDDSELDEYLPAIDDISEQDEFLSPSRNEEAIVNDKERLTQATSTTFEPKGGVEDSKSVLMADCELNGGYRSGDAGFRSEAADRSMEQDDYLPAADESYHEGENQYAQEVKAVAKEEKLTTGEGTSEFEGTEQPSPTQNVNELIGEEMAVTSRSAGDILDPAKTEKESEEAHEVRPCTDAITNCDTVSKFAQRHSDEETRNFTADIGSDNKDDESDVSTSDANQAYEQDFSSHNGESSHKRRRWFENREKVGEFQLPGIFQGIERTAEMHQENAEGLKVEDRVEICVDEIVNESGDGVHMEQADAGSDQDQDGEGLHNTEGTHRRRRWFENSGEKVQLKPIPFNGAGVTAGMDHEIAQEAKQDVSTQGDVDKLMNEGKDGADGMGINMSNDEVERRASTEEGNRRRRWFENGEKYGAAQRPGPAILEDNEVTAEREEEIEMREDTAKHELREASTSEDLASTNQREGHSKERDKEKEKQAVERAMREARQRAFAEARERAAAEARLKAAAAAQDKQGKASSEAKPSSDKASMDAKYKAERAAVERATAEARERALQKAMSDKATLKSREKDGKNQNSGPSCSSGYSTSVPFTSDRSNGTVTESPQRRKAISERNKRTTERAAKALEEKNMRDLLAQKEQAEKNRFASAFDAEVKRWSSGKEGNLRSLLSTLQYILGPDSGWQPIPLTDLVTTTAVRKAYKRAALCVHPDKLQQRRATIQQKYICEKVFDLLKDGWHKFNPDDR